MKQINVFKMIVGMTFSILTFAMTSCSSDDFYGFDDEIIKSGLYDNQAFLDLSDYNDLSHLSSNDLTILSEAEKRIDIKLKGGLYEIKYRNGAEVNISERLFNYITENYNHLNTIAKSYGKIKRTKGSGPESGLMGKDCVPIAISHYCNVDYQTVVNALLGKTFTLVDAVKLFKKDACEQTSLTTGSGSGILVLYEHAVNLESVSQVPGESNYYVYYKDWQLYPNDGGNGRYILVSNLSFPCQNIYGNMTVVYGLVK